MLASPHRVDPTSRSRFQGSAESRTPSSRRLRPMPMCFNKNHAKAAQNQEQSNFGKDFRFLPEHGPALPIVTDDAIVTISRVGSIGVPDRVAKSARVRRVSRNAA